MTPLTTSPNGSILTTSTTKPTQHDYEPCGETRAGPAAPTTSSKPTANPSDAPAPGYIGGLQLPNGNYLLGQREYNPTTGTFLTSDQAGSANPYAYTSGNPLKATDLQGLDDVEGTLTDVSHISGYISTAALVGAVVCTVARACAPAVPIFLEVSSATGVISAGAAGILDSQACVLKGNCTQLAADVAVGLVASRFPAIGRSVDIARSVRGIRWYGDFQANEIRTAAGKFDRNGLTRVGRALQKHSGRSDSVFRGLSSGNASSKNEQGMRVVGEILNDPDVRVESLQNVTNIWDASGRGIRIGNDGTFMGFLEPR